MRSLDLCLLTSTIAAVAACGDDAPGPDPDATATVRVVHASPDAPAVDVYAAGVETPLVADLAYGETSDRVQVPAGAYTLEVRAAGAAASSPPVYSVGPVTLDADADVTAFAAGYLGSTAADDAFRVVPFVEAFGDVASGEARVRIVHASPDAPTVAIDVGNDGSPELDALARFTDSGAAGIPLPANTVTPIGIWAGEPLARVTAFTVPALPEGATLFVAATGNVGDLPRQDTGFVLAAIGDAGVVATVAQDPVVYVLHGSPDAPAVDVLAGDASLVEELAFGELSAPVQVPPGSYSLAINAAGTTTTAATIVTPELAAGERYLAIATGFLGETGADAFQPFYTADAFELDDDSARVAVIHSSPDAPTVDVLAGDAPIVQDLAFPTQTDGVGLELAPGEVTLGVAAANTTTPVATFDVELTAGLRAFVVAQGALAPGAGEQAFGLYAVVTSTWPWSLAALPAN